MAEGLAYLDRLAYNRRVRVSLKAQSVFRPIFHFVSPLGLPQPAGPNAAPQPPRPNCILSHSVRTARGPWSACRRWLGGPPLRSTYVPLLRKMVLLNLLLFKVFIFFPSSALFH